MTSACRVLGCDDSCLPGLPDCAAHAMGETCKHGNQLRYCAPCAIKILNSKGFDVPMGDFVCPVCGKDFPHRHEPNDLRVRPYLQGQSHGHLLCRAAGWLAEPKGESLASTAELIRGLVAELKRGAT